MQIKQFKAVRLANGTAHATDEALAVEAPLQIRVNGEALTTTMRTPGDDRFLARGLLYTEGIVSDRSIVPKFVEVSDPETGLIGCMDISIPPGGISRTVEGRRFLAATSSCGVCGIREPRELDIYGPPLLAPRGRVIDAWLLRSMQEAMRSQQSAYQQSGGSHAAAAFRENGELLEAFEDVGRHNAVDKVVGALIESAALHRAACLVVSGRISFEIVSKAYRAEIPVVAGVSAPSSLAVESAKRYRMTVIGFCRGNRATVYSHPEFVAFRGVNEEEDLEKVDSIQLDQL